MPEATQVGLLAPVTLPSYGIIPISELTLVIWIYVFIALHAAVFYVAAGEGRLRILGAVRNITESWLVVIVTFVPILSLGLLVLWLRAFGHVSSSVYAIVLVIPPVVGLHGGAYYWVSYNWPELPFGFSAFAGFAALPALYVWFRWLYPQKSVLNAVGLAAASWAIGFVIAVLYLVVSMALLERLPQSQS